jgi:hypothetical protein
MCHCTANSIARPRCASNLNNNSHCWSSFCPGSTWSSCSKLSCSTWICNLQHVQCSCSRLLHMHVQVDWTIIHCPAVHIVCWPCSPAHCFHHHTLSKCSHFRRSHLKLPIHSSRPSVNPCMSYRRVQTPEKCSSGNATSLQAGMVKRTVQLC